MMIIIYITCGWRDDGLVDAKFVYRADDDTWFILYVIIVSDGQGIVWICRFFSVRKEKKEPSLYRISPYHPSYVLKIIVNYLISV